MKKIDIKSLVAGILIGSVCLSTAYAATGKKNVEIEYSIKNIKVDEKIIEFTEDNQPFILNDSTFVPIRAISEALGFTVNYFPLDSTIDIRNNVTRYEAISKLLMEATDYIGVSTPESAVEVWAEGLNRRSAALQYSVMTKQLKDEYAKILEEDELYDNWVVGVSSPWVDEYEVEKKSKVNDTTYIYDLNFYTFASDGFIESFAVTLKVIKEGDFWRIAEVNGDKDSEIYTGFMLKK